MGREEVHGPHIRIAASPRPECRSFIGFEENVVADSLVNIGHEVVRDSESEVTLRVFVTSQELEAFEKWVIGR